MSKQALPGTRKNAFAMNPKDLVIIGHDTKHTRKGDDGPDAHIAWDKRVETPPSEEFIASVEELGVLEPVTVYKEPGTGEPIVWYGRNRVRALRIANGRAKQNGGLQREIMVIVRPPPTAAQAFGAMIAENHNRRNDSPAETAALVSEFVGKGYGDEREAAVHFGIARSSVKRYLAIHAAHSDTRKAFDSGRLNLGQATEIAKLDRDEQPEAVRKATANGHSTAHLEADRKRRQGNEEATERPSIGKLKRILERHRAQKKEGKMSPLESADPVKLLRWMLGDGQAPGGLKKMAEK